VTNSVTCIVIFAFKAISLILFYIPTLHADIAFEDVTVEAGLYNESKGWCAAWGDFNNDSWPDLYVNNHMLDRKLYLNSKDGTFTEISNSVFDYQGGKDLKDSHSCIWMDFDNDGDSDLVQVSGGNGGRRVVPGNYNEFFVNEGGMLIDRAVEMDVAYPEARGRTVTSLDYDKDGLLDLFYGTLEYSDNTAPSKIFNQTANGFIESTLDLGLDIRGSIVFSQLSDIHGGGDMELIVNGYPQLHVHSLENVPTTDITNLLFSNPSNLRPRDIVIADLNNDLMVDVFKPRGATSASSLIVRTESEFGFYVGAEEAIPEKVITFQTTGDLTFNVKAPWNQLTDVYIGSNGIHPADWFFNLNSADPNVQGLMEYVPGTDRGIYIGYNTTDSTWTIVLTSPSILLAAADSFTGILTSTLPVSNIQTFGFEPLPRSGVDSIFLGNRGGLFEKMSNSHSGITERRPSTAAVIGDFDNDMDKDIYVVTSSYAGNEANVLYENIGGGSFAEVPDAGGASGTRLGNGASVTTADYDQDGFLDIYFVNGKGVEPLAIGPDQLFRNLGNSNHWLEVDLEGVITNRDATGAKVYATTGGVTQLLEQNGSTHFNSQSHTRLHFGLGSNTLVDDLTIVWPTGDTQKIENVPADQLIHVLESSSPSPFGKPTYKAGRQDGVFIWKDEASGSYHIRTSGSGEKSVFTVKLVSTELISAKPFHLEFNDEWSQSPYGFSLTSRVSTWEDGVDFTIPPGAKVLFSVEQDGTSNPRQLHVGSEGLPLTPAGWIRHANELPARPAFLRGGDVGLFLGRGSTSELLEARYSSNSVVHRADLHLISSEELLNITPVWLEIDDKLKMTNSSVYIDGFIFNGQDGVDLAIDANSDVGVAYTQDRLFQPRHVNPDMGSFGPSNAYWLPLAHEIGMPNYDPANQTNLFMWKDDVGLWHVRVTAGVGSMKYVGVIKASTPYTNLTPFSLESNDILDASDPTQIHFNLNVGKPWRDGFDFAFPPGTTFTLELLDNSNVDADLVLIGERLWHIESLPLNLVQ